MRSGRRADVLVTESTAVRRYAQAAALVGDMEPRYGIAPDEFSLAALCVAVQRSDLADDEAVAEATRIEAAIQASGGEATYVI